MSGLRGVKASAAEADTPFGQEARRRMRRLLLLCLSMVVAAGVFARFGAPYPDRIAETMLANVEVPGNRLALCGLSHGDELDSSTCAACPCSGAAAEWEHGLGSASVWTRADGRIGRIELACVDYPRSLSRAEASGIFERARAELSRRFGPSAKPVTQLDAIGYPEVVATWQVGGSELAVAFHEGNDNWTFRLALTEGHAAQKKAFRELDPMAK